MIEVEKALELIHQTAVKNTSIFTAVSSRICGSVLADDIFSPMSFPHFAQSSMDGYALKSHDSLSYKVVGEMAAGSSKIFYLNPGEAVRIFTGAMVPNSADSVVIQEKVNRLNQNILLEEAPKLGQNIRPIGSMMNAGDLVFSKGHILNPSSIGLLQSIGIRSVLIYNKPSVAIVVTGNELLKPGESFQEGKVFESNSVVLESALKQQGIENFTVYYVQDTLEETQNSLKEALKSDLVLISGGISVGDYDFVRESLENIGVQEEFYKVNQKPGKPLFFGKKDSKMVFALPGNPASTLSCFYVYVVPILHKLLGKKSDGLPRIQTTLDSSITNKFGRALFLKAVVHQTQVRIIDEHNSASLLSFSKANALVFVPSYTTLMDKGTHAKTWLIPN